MKMKFYPLAKTVPIGKGKTVLEVALKNKIPIFDSCGGMGTCTTCLVVVETEIAQPRTEIEQEMAEMRKFSRFERLSCQLEPFDGLVVDIKNQR